MLSWARLRQPGRWDRRGWVIGAAVMSLSSVHCAGAGPDGDDQSSGKAPICRAPASVNAAPQSIDEVRLLVNALAEEHGGTVELPCFVASLSRPLGAMASKGVFSAQPAVGARSPRVFLWSQELVMSIAPDGPGRKLLELGSRTASTRSIKAEIEFPATAQLSATDPYDRIKVANRDGTGCATCHAHEEQTPLVDSTQAFESDMLRPADFEDVDLRDLELESTNCDPTAEPERCALLHSLFDEGGLRPRSFPEDTRTVYGD